MADFYKKQKRSPQKQFFLMVGLVLILVIIVLLSIADIKIYRKKREFNSQIESLKNKIQALQGQNNQLKQGIEMADDATYVEKVAREELDMQQPGEKVVSFIKQSEQQQLAENNNIFQPFWNWIKKYFKF